MKPPQGFVYYLKHGVLKILKNERYHFLLHKAKSDEVGLSHTHHAEVNGSRQFLEEVEMHLQSLTNALHELAFVDEAAFAFRAFRTTEATSRAKIVFSLYTTDLLAVIEFFTRYIDDLCEA